MFGIAFERICWGVIAGVVLSLVILLARGNLKDGRGAGPPLSSKAMEREITSRARSALVASIFEPVERLRAEGKQQEALLKLTEIMNKYPGEAHGYLLQGTIQHGMGVIEEAVVSFAEAVRINGDYVDKQSPLSRRSEIQRVVDDGITIISSGLKSNPGNKSLALTMDKLRYLQSRLAGGCE